MRQLTKKQEIVDHKNHDIKLSNSWKYDKYPAYGDEKIGSEINNSAYVVAVKKNWRLTFRVNDGRIGGIVVILESNKKSHGGSVYVVKKKYDDALHVFHSFIRMI